MIKKAVQYLKRISSVQILAVLFLVFVIHVGFRAFPQFLTNTGTTMLYELTFADYIERIDTQYHDMLTVKADEKILHNNATYINFNGLMARLMGQREVNQRYKLNNGHLVAPSDPIQEDELDKTYQSLLSLYEHQKANGKHFLFVLAPFQVDPQQELLPAGFINTDNESADHLLSMLEQSDVPFLDLRKSLKQDGITTSDAFFITDHHWKPETGFWAFGKIVEHLSENGSIAPINSFYTTPENYHYTIYEDAFLGSSGKRTGIYYAGVDDFCVITPKFETNISLRIEETDVDVSGSFADVAFRPDTTAICEQKKYFNHNLYAVYGRSDHGHMHWWNENAPEQQKVMLIGDSFGNVPFSFMSLYFSSCEELDMRHFKENFSDLYDAYVPDHVIVLVSTYGINAVNVQYDFFPENNK